MNHFVEDTDLEHLDRLIATYGAVAKANGFETVWSFWRSDEWQDMADVSGIPTGTVIRYWDYYGRDLRAVVEGTTWLDVWRACDEVIVESNDPYRIYIEQLTWATIEQPNGTVQKFLDLTTGS